MVAYVYTPDAKIGLIALPIFGWLFFVGLLLVDNPALGVNDVVELLGRQKTPVPCATMQAKSKMFSLDL